jgi:UDP:flavonoid glycosyltransferase YjiC (YdhE family)
VRVLFTSVFGAGHLLPLLPYAREMAAQGHSVRVAVADDLAERVIRAGLEHVPTDRPSDAEQTEFFAQFKDVPPAVFNARAGSMLFADLLPRRALPATLAEVAAWRPHLIVREASEYAGAIVGEMTGTPHVRVSVCNGHTLRPASVEYIDAIRTDNGLAPDGGASIRAARAFSSFPASMEPEGEDCADLPQVRVAPPPRPAPGPAPDWLDPAAGPHLYMTFGTEMGSSEQAKATFRAALDAVGAVGIRTLMTTGPSMDVGALGQIPSNVMLRDFVPQDEVFGHVAAVLDHGGSGTMLGALAAGLPQVIAPIGADQPHNAEAIEKVAAGVSTGTTPDAATVEAALRRVLEDSSLRAGAERVAAEMAGSLSLPEAVNEMLRHARPTKAIA